MGHVINILFNPPPMPQIELPLPVHLVPGIKMTIEKAFNLAYYRGVYDGVIAGILLTLLLVPTIKSRIAKGATNVADHI